MRSLVLFSSTFQFDEAVTKKSSSSTAMKVPHAGRTSVKRLGLKNTGANFLRNKHSAVLFPTFRASFLSFANNRFQDGSVLLAKYLEHQAVGMRRELGLQQPCGESHPLPPTHETAESISDGVNDTKDKTRGSNKPPVVRVLELGCGTGLAGLAAAFSFGRRGNVDAHGESRAALPPFPQQTQPFESEEDGVRTCSSSHAVVDGGAEVVLTDLEYALANARENINRNASSLKAIGGAVKVMELDWCRPLPEGFVGELVAICCASVGMATKMCSFDTWRFGLRFGAPSANLSRKITARFQLYGH